MFSELELAEGEYVEFRPLDYMSSYILERDGDFHEQPPNADDIPSGHIAVPVLVNLVPSDRDLHYRIQQLESRVAVLEDQQRAGSSNESRGENNDKACPC